MGDKGSNLTNVAVKSAILSGISILCAVVSLVLYLWKHIATLIELNVPFSCFCVVLMHTRYKNVFDRACCLCTACCSRAMRSNSQLSSKRKNEQGLSMAIGQNSPTTPKVHDVTHSSDIVYPATPTTPASTNTAVQMSLDVV